MSSVRVLVNYPKVTPFRDYFVGFRDAVKLVGQGKLKIWLDRNGHWLGHELDCSQELAGLNLKDASEQAGRLIEAYKFANDMLDCCH